jgi:hypothetical protein
MWPDNVVTMSITFETKERDSKFEVVLEKIVLFFWRYYAKMSHLLYKNNLRIKKGSDSKMS